MAEIKLKVIGAAGDTLAVSRAGERISLVHTAPYADGDWIALECDEPGLYCVVQLEDTMPPALVYIRERGLDFPIPPADNRVNYSPRSFTGTCHLLPALPRRRRSPRGETSHSTPTTATAATDFTRTHPLMWKRAARLCLLPATPWTAFMRMTPTAHGRTKAGASTATPTPR